MTIGFLAMAASGLGWGLLVDRFGPRIVVLIGTLLLGRRPRAREPRDQPA